MLFLLQMNTVCQEVFSAFSSDRLVPGLDTVVPSETTKAYDMLDIIQAVCIALTLKSADQLCPKGWH